jgi:transcription initiation factor IIE alpha subunit
MLMRIAITNVWNRPHTIEWTERAWYAEWDAIKQDEIKEWVHKMIKVNQEILDYEGGNEFYR